MNISIEDKGSAVFKLTITAAGDVRIKLQKSTDEATRGFYVKVLTETADEVIRLGLNTQTLRGKVSEGRNGTLYNGKREPVYPIKVS